MKRLTIEELKAQLEAQNAELGRLAELTADLPPGFMLPESALGELEEVMELRTSVPTPAPALPFFSIRV